MTKHKRFPPLFQPVWAPRFWRLVSRPMITESIPDPDACWEWKGAVDTDGYGVFEHNGSKQAHKVAYELKVGPVPKGMVLLHSCDNPPCCNWHHLTHDTQQANMQDMVSKGRHGNRYTSPVSIGSQSPGLPGDSPIIQLEINQVCTYCGKLTTELESHMATCEWKDDES